METNKTSVRDVSFESFSTLKETSEFLVSKGPDALITAGSTDVLVHTQKKGYPKFIVGMNLIDGLDYVESDSKEVRIGALTTLTKISETKIIQEHFPALSMAAREMASPQIRNKGTIAGNLCNASPAADTAPALLVYDAKLKVYNQGEERIVELSDFFLAPGKTILESGDIVTEVIIPVKEGMSSSFTKIGRRKALEISILNMAMNIKVEGNVITEAKVACGSVAPKPLVVEKTSNALTGLTVNNEEDLQNAIETIRKEVTPIDDIRGTASYRTHMIGITLKRMVLDLVGGAK